MRHPFASGYLRFRFAPIAFTPPEASQRSAVIYTMVENCRLHGIDPLAYLTDVMPRLVDREEGADVSDLLPRQRKAAREAP